MHDMNDQAVVMRSSKASVITPYFDILERNYRTLFRSKDFMYRNPHLLIQLWGCR